jgi:hypothetical protein
MHSKIVLRYSVIILLITALNKTYAQEDVAPDYRSKMDNFTRVHVPEMRSDLSTFTLAGIDESTGKNSLATITPTAYGTDSLSFNGNGISVNIKAGVFNAAKHKLGYYDKYLVKIDNKGYFGNYWFVPKTTIASVTVIIKGDTVAIPAAAYNDLYSPSFEYNEGGNATTHNGVYLSADGHTIYIYMLNKEARGNYEVTWIIQDKKYLRRVVDTGLLK